MLFVIFDASITPLLLLKFEYASLPLGYNVLFISYVKHPINQLKILNRISLIWKKNKKDSTFYSTYSTQSNS